MAGPCVYGMRYPENCECANCRDWQMERRRGGGKSRGGRSASPLVDGYGSTKDQGKRGAKRQNNKNHGTNRRGGRR